MGRERNYGRFYSLLKRMPLAEKEALVAQFTNGRTSHLRETTNEEYKTMCDSMERSIGEDPYSKRRRKRRSECLHLMQQLGVDTSDWQRVDDFCKNPRVSGKKFAWLTLKELEELEVKLRMIKKHGGLRKKTKEPLQSNGRDNKQYYLLINTTDYGKEN